MAFLRDLPKPICRCGRRATVELVNRFNAVHGCYCRACGRRKIASLVQGERRANEVLRRVART